MRGRERESSTGVVLSERRASVNQEQNGRERQREKRGGFSILVKLILSDERHRNVTISAIKHQSASEKSVPVR